MLKNNFKNGCLSPSILQKLIVDGSHVRNGHLNEKILEKNGRKSLRHEVRQNVENNTK